MTEPRLINGVSVTKHILRVLIAILGSIGGGFWSLSHFIKKNQSYQSTIDRLDLIFIFDTLYYGLLICAIGILIGAIYLITLIPRQLLNLEDKPFSKKLDKIIILPFVFTALLIAPTIIGGHYYDKYKFTKSGYTQCNNPLINTRSKRVFVLYADDCHDRKLRWIFKQRDKYSSEILREVHAYLRQKHQVVLSENSES